MKFTDFEKFTRLLGIATITTTTLLAGCGSKVISEGNFGLSQPFLSGTFNREALSKGLNLKVWATIEEFYGREEMVKIDNIQPKDKDNVLLRELDLIVTYSINKDHAVEFLIKTNDIVSKNNIYYLGTQRIDRDARNTIGQTVNKFSSLEILNNIVGVEAKYKVDLQGDLDTLYGKGTIIVNTIKISNVRVSEAIENRIQSIAVINAETAKNAATMAVLANRESTLTKEAQLIANVAKTSGLSVDQLLQYETIKAIHDGAVTHLQVQTGPKTVKP